MGILGSVFTGMLANVSTELAKSLIESRKEKKDNDRKTVERIKCVVGEICDEYEENINEPIKTYESITDGEVIEFLCEQNDALGEFVTTLDSYKESVRSILPKKSDTYMKRVEHLREIQNTVEAFKKDNIKLDTEKILNQYYSDLIDLYHVFE